MILEDIVKELANRINQPHVIRTYLLKVRDTAYKIGLEEGKKQCGLANVVGQSEQLKAFVDWWHNLSQEELVWYEGRYVEVFLSL